VKVSKAIHTGKSGIAAVERPSVSAGVVSPDRPDAIPGRDINWRWVVELLSVMLGLAVIPVLVGIALDWRLQTAPVITLCMMLLGFNLGILTLYRRIAVVYARVAPPDSVPSSEAGSE
jgi:hypothetical protein